MAAALDRQQPGVRAVAGRREDLGFVEPYRFVLGAMNDEPGNPDPRGRCLDIQGLGILLDVIEHVGIERQDLAGAGILDVGLAASAPGAALVLRPALDSGDSRPSHQGSDARISRGLQDCGATAARMANQSERTRHRNTESAAHECVENALKVLELGGEGVVSETIRQGELTGGVYTAPAEVEGDGGES